MLELRRLKTRLQVVATVIEENKTLWKVTAQPTADMTRVRLDIVDNTGPKRSSWYVQSNMEIGVPITYDILEDLATRKVNELLVDEDTESGDLGSSLSFGSDPTVEDFSRVTRSQKVAGVA
jgi:hypothetical protein